MQWFEVQAAHPERWLVVEALEARSEHGQRIFDRVQIVELCADGRTAMKRYAELHRQHPDREFCFVHTSKTELVFEERLWFGIRGLRATDLSA